MTLKRQLPLEGKLLDSITIRSHEHYIINHMMESCSVVFHTKRHTRHSRKLTTVCAEITNTEPNLGTDFEDLATTSQKWFMMPSPTLSDARLVRSMVTSSIKHQVIFIQHLLHGPLRCGEWTSLTHKPSNIQNTSVHHGYKWLLLQMGRSHPLKEVKTFDMIKFIKYHVVYRFRIPRWIAYDNGLQFVNQAF